MKTLMMTTAAATLIAGAAFAEGNAADGEAAFKQCQSCHVVVDDEGNTLAGRKAKTGPNLVRRARRVAGTVEGFRYGKDIVEAGKEGLVWNEENFTAYVKDPTKFLREFTDDPKARGKMTFKVRKEQDAHDLWAYLVSVSPAPEAGDDS